MEAITVFAAVEKELDLAFEAAIACNLEFRQWFRGKTRLGSEYPDFVSSRADHSWGKVEVLLPNPASGALEMIERDDETDLLLVFENASGTRAAFHIEHMRPSGSFTPHQPEVCAARAAHWAGNPACGGYHVWETVLLAPLSFYEGHLADARKFTTFISYEEVAAFIPAFQQEPAS